jgi:hypothetical protein
MMDAFFHGTLGKLWSFITHLFCGEVTMQEQVSCAPLARTCTLGTTLASLGAEDMGEGL